MEKNANHLILAAILVAAAFAAVGCKTNPPVVITQVPVDISQTSPNLTIIKFANAEGTPIDNQQLIGSVFLKWERENPDRKIISFQIIYRMSSPQYYGYVDGIFIYSEPR